MSDSNDLSEALTEKIIAYVEREAGHDAPLSPQDEAMVRDLLATDPAAQTFAEDFRETDARFGALLDALGDGPEEEDDLTRLIREHGALTEKGRDQEAADLLADFTERRRKGLGVA
jgi:anti-sigma factor RsiW